MENTWKKLALAASVMAFMGAGCAGSSTTAVAPTPSAKADVKFSATGMNILDSEKDYKEFRFDGLTGDCATKGVPVSISYVEDPTLKYFVVKDQAGTFQDNLVSAAFTGQVNFTAKTSANESVACTMVAAEGTDSGPITCKKADKPFCTGTMNITAVPR